jgi:hypothetical protein
LSLLKTPGTLNFLGTSLHLPIIGGTIVTFSEDVTVFSGIQGATFCPRNSSVMCTACYTKVRFMYEICLAEVEKFVKIKNLVQY